MQHARCLFLYVSVYFYCLITCSKIIITLSSGLCAQNFDVRRRRRVKKKDSKRLEQQENGTFFFKKKKKKTLKERQQEDERELCYIIYLHDFVIV